MLNCAFLFKFAHKTIKNNYASTTTVVIMIIVLNNNKNNRINIKSFL